jgi:hypothetical protein
MPASIAVLYWNEGRAVDASRALSRGAAAIIEVNAAAVDPGENGKLVHLSGTMQPATPARDPVFGVTGDGLLRLSRSVEMYQWKETTSSQSQQSVGGSKTTETTYNYQRVWSAQPIVSAQFKVRDGHQNPPMQVQSATFDVGGVQLGAYGVDPPLSNGVLTGYRDANGYTIALAEPGVVTAAALFHDEQTSENRLTWILRGVGFVAMLIGFVCMTRPLTMVFAVLPFLESLVGVGAFLVALTLAVPITLVTIAVGWIAHRPVIGGGLLVGAVVALYLRRRLHPRRPVQATA